MPVMAPAIIPQGFETEWKYVGPVQLAKADGLTRRTYVYQMGTNCDNDQ